MYIISSINCFKKEILLIMEYNFAKIGERIKKERKGKNWTQKKLMEKLSPYCPLGRNTLSDIENGICSNISLTLFSTLCKEEFFDCDMGYLLCEYDEKHHIVADIKETTGLESDVINIILNMKNSFLKVSLLNNLLRDDYFLAIVDLLHLTDYHYAKCRELKEIENKIALEHKHAETLEEKEKLQKKYGSYTNEHTLHESKAEADRYRLTVAFSRLLDKRYDPLPNIDLTNSESKWKQENPAYSHPIIF